ncbi:uncharacterized protein K460DRAFT_367308 [Cucurbitaria berberidis CBS 394.84]|uniref:Uncharacterized protein n=1 Tax=Cucurbitaria berberidis CBS 394.84 TaxID=1168544 RepID=A0A9P4GJF3_9PLEO|nr:uncharacterized protein K460DRAFT_367308 [Cucurbitaria berberidis CBS 394.84]KAF1846554.1 hypothetical protein K460DRAFT_367308 [Cucurbitaria berberidis CBS 394.84]
MCYYERINCGKCRITEHRLIQHCHFARNDPGHQCFGAWNIKRERTHDCDSCIEGKRGDQTGTAATRNVQSSYRVASGR